MITITEEQIRSMMSTVLRAHLKETTSWKVNDELWKAAAELTESPEFQAAIEARLRQIIDDTLNSQDLMERIRARVVQNIEARLDRKLRGQMLEARLAEMKRMKGEA